MHNMAIIDLQQGSEEWLKWRKTGITATDTAVILDKSPYKTPWRLWAEKTGYAQAEDLSNNPNVKRGHALEDFARQTFEEKHNDMLLPVCIESTVYPFMKASLDGLRENGEPVELKCPSQSTWEKVCSERTKSEAYQLYYYQVQHQILVADATNGWLVFYYQGEMLEFYISRDDALLDEMVLKAEEFWNRVVKRKEPDKDPERDLYIPQGKEVNEWIYAAEQYRVVDSEIQELKAKLKQLESNQKTHLDAMKTLMGDFYHTDYCGLMITKYVTEGRINYKKVLEDKGIDPTAADLDVYRGKSSERYRVTVTESVKPRYIVDEKVLDDLADVPEEVDSYYF